MEKEDIPAVESYTVTRILKCYHPNGGSGATLLIMFYKVVLSCKSVDEILKRDH